MSKSEPRDRPLRRVKRATPSGLIQLSLGESPERQEAVAFVVRLGRERSVEVPSDFDEDALQRLLGVLEQC